MAIQTRRGRWIGVLLWAWVLLASGCGVPQPGSWEGPQALSTASVESWSYKGREGYKLVSPHYVIYTTIQAEETRSLLPQVMEGAFTQFRALSPNVPISNKPMSCFIFASRQEFNVYTKENTGNASGVYLQIRRGGYALGDRYVSYDIGVNATASVAAHEGWHQFAACNFKGRLPPFLEEGLATTFEGVDFTQKLPRWNVAINPLRAQALRRTVDENHVWPLEKLIRTHAGQVVNQGGAEVDAFYSESWAFAKFLRQAEGGRYAPALRLLLFETAAGTVFDPSHSHNRAGLPWNPSAVKPMLEHYLQMPLSEIDRAFQIYIRKIAYEEYPAQWNLNGWS